MLAALVRVCVCVCVFVSVWVGGRGCTSVGVCLCVCRLSYPVCHAKAPYCLRFVWLYCIFRHSLISGTIFGKKGH